MLSDTYDSLEQLTEIIEQSRFRFSQLCTLQIRIAEAQPQLSPSLLEFINQAINKIQARIPALKQSIQEIKSSSFRCN